VFKNLFGFAIIVFAVLAVGWFAMKRGDIPYHTLETAYANEASEFMTLKDGLKVHYRDEGLIDGPTIVLVHGFSASLHTWEGWVKGLKTDHRVISLDLPAHGLTRAPDEYPVTIDQFVKVVDELTAYLGAESFVLAGSSMGGNTAWEYALAHPDKLDGLVLVGASGWPESDDEAGGDPLIFQLMANPVARWLLKDLDMTILIRGGLEDSFVDTSFVTEEMVNRYASMSRAPGHRDGILRMMSDPGNRRLATTDMMAQIKVPTLILHGDGDKLVPVEGGRKFAQTISGSSLVIYDDVGHLPQEETLQQTLLDLRNFLSERVYPSSDLETEASQASARQSVSAAQ